MRNDARAIGSRVKQHRSIVENAASLVATNAITSGLGFFYWLVAARMFDHDDVGLAATWISAMSLLSYVGMFGLGTLLIQELPRRPDRAPTLISTSLVVATLFGGILGFGFALIASWLSGGFQPIVSPLLFTILFSLSVATTALSHVLDQALVGLLQGRLQLVRNTIFSAAKLVLLVVAGVVAGRQHDSLIFVSWLVGIIVSFIALSRLLVGTNITMQQVLPAVRLLIPLVPQTWNHHLINMALLVPGMALPLVVTATLSAEFTAGFYMAWMLAYFIFVVSNALSTMLYATGSRDPDRLSTMTRFTMSVATAIVVPVSIVVIIIANPLLSIFGPEYASTAAWSLRILAIAAVPVVIKDHYVAICRIHGNTAIAARVLWVGAIGELALASSGAILSDLTGLATGWMIAVTIESAYMYRHVRSASTTSADLDRSANPGTA